MDSSLPKGVEFSAESPANHPGVYRHEGAGVELTTQPGVEGFIQADALVRVGYKRVGDVPSRQELLTMQKRQAARDMAEEKATKLKEEAELKALADEILEEAKAEIAAKAKK